MPVEIPSDQKSLRNLIARRHPDYAEKIEHWEFLEETYKGGKEWFPKNIHRYFKEGEKEFEDRIERAYRFNHTRETVDLVQKYIFKSAISRKDGAPEAVSAFWKNATLSGLDISQFMRMISTAASIHGMVWIFMDTTKTTSLQSKKDEKKLGARIYAYMKTPIDVLDFAYDGNGDLTWILVREYVRDDENPFGDNGGVVTHFRLWFPNEYVVFEEIKKGDKETIIKVVESGTHDFGFVPAFSVAHTVGEYKYSAPGLIDDIAYLDKAVANYLSNLDAIIQDQTFSQLVMPAQAMLPGDDGYEKLLDMGTKRVFTFDSEGGEPKYISPDPKQANVILQVINKIIGEIYHTIGLAGERTKQDNAVGIDNSSGVAKAYDFERVNALLASKAKSLENAENRMIDFVLRLSGAGEVSEEQVKYPETFDVYSLFDEFTVAEKLTLIDAPSEVRRGQMKQIIDKLFPYASKETREKMETDLKSWPPKIELTASPTPSKFGTTKPAATSRQGEVTSKSK